MTMGNYPTHLEKGFIGVMIGSQMHPPQDETYGDLRRRRPPFRLPGAEPFCVVFGRSTILARLAKSWLAWGRAMAPTN
jgi:hypothetical protein